MYSLISISSHFKCNRHYSLNPFATTKERKKSSTTPNCCPAPLLAGWLIFKDKDRLVFFVFLNKHDPCGFSQGKALQKRKKETPEWERKGRALNNYDTLARTKRDKRSYRRGGWRGGGRSAIHLDPHFH